MAWHGNRTGGSKKTEIKQELLSQLPFTPKVVVYLSRLKIEELRELLLELKSIPELSGHGLAK